MTISSGRIVAGPTQTRADAKESYAKITNYIPPSGGLVLDPDTNVLSFITQNPEREGQVLVYNAQNETTMYVVVDINGTLTWKRCVALTGYIDSTTGKPFGL
jgi:hypothetical protein